MKDVPLGGGAGLVGPYIEKNFHYTVNVQKALK